MPDALVGPTANLPGYARRAGDAGTCLRDGRTLGEVVGIEWGLEIAQIEVRIPGKYRTEMKPGGETRNGTFHIQDLDDSWALQVWDFVQARKSGDRSAAAFPEFSIVTKIDDIGAPAKTRWQLDGCQLFQLIGGYSTDDELLSRDIPFSYRDERPLDAYVYTDGGVQIRNA